jgi:hypothetical protein
VFDHSLHSGGFYIITDPESVIEKEKKAGYDVFHQRLGTKADGQTDDTGTGNQGASSSFATMESIWLLSR